MVVSWLKLINSSAILVLALIAGLLAFKNMRLFSRIIFLQLVVWVIFLTCSYLLTIWQRSTGLERDNQLLMNIHLVIETILLIVASFYLFQHKWQKNTVKMMLISFPVIATYLFVRNGISEYSNYTDLTACFFISFLYAFGLYESFKKPQPAWWRSPEIYICTGILTYSACSIPYVALMDFLQRNHPQINAKLFLLINDVLANFRYLMVAIAFWLINKNMNLKSSSNE